MTVFEKLDKILAFLKNDININSQEYLVKFVHENNLEISLDEQTAILAKLYKDDLVFIRKFDNIEMDLKLDLYYLTIEGLTFEGYVEKENIRIYEKKRIEDIEENQIRIQKRLFWLTLILAISSIVNAWYYIHLYLIEK